MNLNKNHWTKNDYNEFLDYLDTLCDKKYLDFHKGLVLESKKMRGIRTPLLKNIAKDISKGNYKEFINVLKNDSYEETIIYGLILGYIKVDINILFEHLDNFVSNIDNWATNDIVAANLKVFQKNQAIGFKKIKEYIKSNHPWTIRFGLVLLLDHYINNDYIDQVLNIANEVDNNDYYIKMANAWLISICYIKYKDKTTDFLLNTKIDNWTFNKSISKIRDSFRVLKEDKDYLITIKR